MKYYYPAVFAPGVDCYEVIIPFIGCFTQGDDITDCMEMAQDAIGTMLNGVAEKEYPAPKKISDVNLSDYPQGSFVSYVCFDKEAYDAAVKKNLREVILSADNPIRELLNRKHMKIKELSDLLGCPYRACQEWSLGHTKPPAWVLTLILDKVLD